MNLKSGAASWYSLHWLSISPWNRTFHLLFALETSTSKLRSRFNSISRPSKIDFWLQLGYSCFKKWTIMQRNKTVCSPNIGNWITIFWQDFYQNIITGVLQPKNGVCSFPSHFDEHFFMGQVGTHELWVRCKDLLCNSTMHIKLLDEETCASVFVSQMARPENTTNAKLWMKAFVGDAPMSLKSAQI